MAAYDAVGGNAVAINGVALPELPPCLQVNPIMYVPVGTVATLEGYACAKFAVQLPLGLTAICESFITYLVTLDNCAATLP
jgi:hypothetical protein